jgi:LysR family transcriptional regulator, cyn operon transcriptional activator
VPSTVRFVAKRIQIMPLLQDGKALGAWGGLAWDPRRTLPSYAQSFIDDLSAYVSRTAPGRRFQRTALPLTRTPA